MAASIEIPGVDFAELARQVIAVKLTEALSLSPEGMQQLVLSAMTHKVRSEDGQQPRYHGEHTVTWVEYVAGDLIRKATKEALAEKVDEMRPKIKAAVEAQLKRQTSTIAAALVDTYAQEAKNGYRLSVSMQFQKNDR